MNIIDAILGGERDPQTLAKLRHDRCKHDEATIALALQGNWRDEHLFVLRQALDLYRVYQQKLGELDAQIESYLWSFADRSVAETTKTCPRPRKKTNRSKHEPAFDTRELLFRMTGVDLTTIDGIGSHAALQLISEIGTDMSRWATDKHFCSWLNLCPGVNKTGGRQRSRSGRTRPSANRAARALRLCAQTLLRADCALGAFGRRLRSRLGAPKAITAMAHKLAKIVYGMLKAGKPYVDQGANYYQERYHEHLLHNLRRRAGQLGYSLAPTG